MAKKKQVTLPIGNKKVFEKLAQIAWRVEKESMKSNPDSEERDEFFDHILQELGKDAFLYSFTPSGEIGDGLNTLDNPQTPRISKKFYEEAMEQIFGSKGKMTQFFIMSNPSAAVQKDRMRRFKSAVVALVQLYLESSLKLTIRQKIPKNLTKDEKRQYPITSFNYPIKGNQSDDEWYSELVKVEMHRYTRLFVAAIFFSSISKLFNLKIGDFSKAIVAQDMLGINGLPTPKKKFAKLKNIETRKKFVQDVLKNFNVGVSSPSTRKDSKGIQPMQPTPEEQQEILIKKIKK
jgi:hypothetical protein